MNTQIDNSTAVQIICEIAIQTHFISGIFVDISENQIVSNTATGNGNARETTPAVPSHTLCTYSYAQITEE